MKKLTNTEANVLAVALDHMEEHLTDVLRWGIETDALDNVVMNSRLDALKTLKAKLL
tara:strand:- start:333 stop:503 length:171 start_codon:yes stop_codon:yes gene_type:complete